MNCPCSKTLSYSECCEPLHKNKNVATSSEQLMRSRYSAYALGLGEYLYETTDPKFASREEIVEYISQSKEQLEWLQLDVISSSKNRVEFKAYYMEDEKLFVLHEKSEFINIDGKWFYESGELLTSKIERNIPCPCGSGKKVKKCHK